MDENKIILKERLDLLRNITSESLDKYYDICFKYGEKLLNKGWLDSRGYEGGVISPDFSSIYITNRSPYEGELLQFSQHKEAEYLKLKEELLKTGDFMYEKDINKELGYIEPTEEEKKAARDRFFNDKKEIEEELDI